MNFFLLLLLLFVMVVGRVYAVTGVGAVIVFLFLNERCYGLLKRCAVFLS